MTATLWASLATIVAVWAVTVLSPGPNFFVTVLTASRQSPRLGVLVSAGIALGTTIWATASLLGLALLFQSAAWLYQALKLAGGLYLVYLGLRTILAARSQAEPGRQPAAPLTARGAVLRGLVVDLSNPKAAIFFASLFAVAVPPDSPLWFKALVVALVVAMAGGWYAAVACLIKLRPIAAALERTQKAVAYVTGAVFVALGLRLATER